MSLRRALHAVEVKHPELCQCFLQAGPGFSLQLYQAAHHAVLEGDFPEHRKMHPAGEPGRGGKKGGKEKKWAFGPL